MLLAAAMLVTAVVVLGMFEDPLEGQVVEIVRSANDSYPSEAAYKIAELGPRTLPFLHRLVAWRETPLSRLYEKTWPRLPTGMQRHLRDPRERPELRGKAVEVVNFLGPAAARPMAGALGRVLNDTDRRNLNRYSGIAALQGLSWSLPESPIAVSALTNWLADPAHGYWFGYTNAADFLPQSRQTIVLLIPCLRNRQVAGEVADCLASMGSNAAPAIPALIQLADLGVAQPLVTPEFTLGYPANYDVVVLNRSAGLTALGKMGVASPEVIEALHRGIGDTNVGVRMAAIGALIELRQPLPATLVSFLPEPGTNRNYEFQAISDWLGTTGDHDRATLAWLRQFAPPDPKESFSQASTLAEANDTLRESAVFALCRLDPAEATNYLPEVLAGMMEQFDGKWAPWERSITGTPIATTIVGSMESWLAHTNIYSGLLAAHAILVLQPDHTGAMELVRKTAKEGELMPRLMAAHLWWQRSGEVDLLLPTCIEGLKRPDDNIAQTSVGFLGEMGDRARPAIPALKAALWHPDLFVRDDAGKVLRKIAPEELPAMR